MPLLKWISLNQTFLNHKNISSRKNWVNVLTRPEPKLETHFPPHFSCYFYPTGGQSKHTFSSLYVIGSPPPAWIISSVCSLSEWQNYIISLLSGLLSQVTSISLKNPLNSVWPNDCIICSMLGHLQLWQ